MPALKELVPHVSADLKRRKVQSRFFHFIPYNKKHSADEKNAEFLDALPGLTQEQIKLLRKRRSG